MKDPIDLQAPKAKSIDLRVRIVVIVAVLVVLGGLLVAKTIGGTPTTPATATPGQSAGAAPTAGGPSQSRGDTVAAYEAALKVGKPIYVLFHSTTCAPCVEISAIADEVIPGYTDKITFVDAVTDDPSAQELAARFSFQYIPTSFFLKPDGTVADSFTGVLTAEEMRGRLDTLVGQ